MDVRFILLFNYKIMGNTPPSAGNKTSYLYRRSKPVTSASAEISAEILPLIGGTEKRVEEYLNGENYLDPVDPEKVAKISENPKGIVEILGRAKIVEILLNPEKTKKFLSKLNIKGKCLNNLVDNVIMYMLEAIKDDPELLREIEEKHNAYFNPNSNDYGTNPPPCVYSITVATHVGYMLNPEGISPEKFRRMFEKHMLHRVKNNG
jgi:hypothetical protein